MAAMKILIFLAMLLVLSSLSLGCNEAVCASTVSKCILTQSCECDFKNNATCSKLCYHCLDYLYEECCSCVGMCPQTDADILPTKSSHIEELQNPIPELFDVLTEEEDRLLRWKTYTMPIHIKYLTDVDKDLKMVTETKLIKTHSDGIDRVEEISVNCTVVYKSECTSWNKCKLFCTSMGAKSYRWFHDGCCECVGSYCKDHGINENRCLHCPVMERHEGEEDQEQSLLTNSIHETNEKVNYFEK